VSAVVAPAVRLTQLLAAQPRSAAVALGDTVRSTGTALGGEARSAGAAPGGEAHSWPARAHLSWWQRGLQQGGGEWRGME
jgi:hypothetical protein